MSLSAVVTPGKVLTGTEAITNSKLNLLGSPTVSLSGGVSASQIADGAVTVAKLATSLQGRVLNVCDAPYSADPTGVNDARSAIQDAIDDLATAGGGILRIPKGNYYLTRADDLTGPPTKVDASENYCLKIEASNIIVQGDGMGLTEMHAEDESCTLLFVSGSVRNIGISGITFKRDTGDSVPFKLEGAAEQNTGTLLALCGEWEEGTANINWLQQVAIEKCEFRDIVTTGIFMGYVRGARIANCDFSYYKDHTAPGTGSYWPLPRECIWSRTGPVQDIVIANNTANGNCEAVDEDSDGADGFARLDKGGNVTIANNALANFKLEVVAVAAAPLCVTGNVFTSVCGNTDYVAIQVYPDITQATPDPAALGYFILSPQYSVLGNVVNGNGYHGRGIQLGTIPSGVTGQAFNGVISGNTIRNVTNGLVINGADALTIVGNVVQACVAGVNYTISGALRKCQTVIIAGNNFMGCATSLGFNSRVEKMLIVTNNILSRLNNNASAYHGIFVGDVANPYVLQWGQNTFVDENGTEIAPYLRGNDGGGEEDLIGVAGLVIRGRLGRTVWSGSVPAPAAAYHQGDTVFLGIRGQNMPYAFECMYESGGTGKFTPVFGAIRGVRGFARILSTTAGTAAELLPGLTGFSLRLVRVQFTILGSTSWSGGTLTKLILRTKGEAHSTLAEVLVAKLAGTTIQVADADVSLFQSTNDTGGMGGVLPSGYGLEVIGVDGSGDAANCAAGSPVLVTVEAVYEQ